MSGEENNYYTEGYLYYFGLDREKDTRKGFEYLLRAASEEEDLVAQLALKYLEEFNGDVSPSGESEILFIEGQSREGWREELSERAKPGDILARFVVACLSYYGEGVKQSYEEAAFWFQKAAERGFEHAQYILGSMAYKGLGGKESYSKARFWFSEAAHRGHAGAQYYLGEMIEEGLGSEPSREQAIQLYNLAADQGHEEAIKALRRLQ